MKNILTECRRQVRGRAQERGGEACGPKYIDIQRKPERCEEGNTHEQRQSQRQLVPPHVPTPRPDEMKTQKRSSRLVDCVEIESETFTGGRNTTPD